MNRWINQSVFVAVAVGAASLMFPPRVVAAGEVKTETVVERVVERPMVVEEMPQGSYLIERTIETKYKPLKGERGTKTSCVVEKTIEQPVILEKAGSEPLIIEKVVERPVIVEKTIERPVIIERTVETPRFAQTTSKEESDRKAGIEKVKIERTVSIPVVVVRGDFWW